MLQSQIGFIDSTGTAPTLPTNKNEEEAEEQVQHAN